MRRKTLLHKTTLITGAGSGIGRATARLFAERGSGLMLLGRDVRRLDKLREELSFHGVPIKVIQADVSDTQALRRLLTEADSTTPVDIAVINAGIGLTGPFVKTDWSHIENVLHTNVDGAFATAHALAQGMSARGSGSIVMISSVLGRQAIPWNATYCASKFALIGFADALRLELRSRNVHVGVIGPSRTATEFFDRLHNSAPGIPQRKLPTATPESVARAILKMVVHKRREMMLTTGGRVLASFGRHFPRVSSAIIGMVMKEEQ
jgi:short-subunit dehydrogenase